ncbi:unnamed protein product [Tuber melanosporum]|uniref:(Perigord truffle) hypothetical protein n=1 Tax=Tuber melanosporum (strain Mel28) TaxID=656061 RepID=D5GI28_TUBMM|nr:uncharacterized protein GSTUM_00008242001 [Tuber melanosporum]CAZ84171.1 unnamed protein product [Tuber melanosporum]
MARGEFERAKRELVFDGVFTEEYFARGGVWLYAIAEQGEEGEGEVTLDRVVEMHPLVKRWVCRVEELARGIGVGVEELELERGVGREVEEGKGEEDGSEVGAEAEAQI